MKDKLIEAPSSEHATYYEYSKAPLADRGLIDGPGRKQKVFVLKDGTLYRHRRLVWDSAGGNTYHKPQ